MKLRLTFILGSVEKTTTQEDAGQFMIMKKVVGFIEMYSRMIQLMMKYMIYGLILKTVLYTVQMKLVIMLLTLS